MDKTSASDRETIEYINAHPGKTATELAKVLKRKLASFSGRLTKLCDVGLLVRKEGVGPRGGYGYFTPSRPSRDQDKTAWQHIMDD